MNGAASYLRVPPVTPGLSLAPQALTHLFFFFSLEPCTRLPLPCAQYLHTGSHTQTVAVAFYCELK